MAVVVSKFAKDTMYNVIVLDFSKKQYDDVHQLQNIFYAKTGKSLPDKWLLSDITQYQISNDGIFIDINKFLSPTTEAGEPVQCLFNEILTWFMNLPFVSGTLASIFNK